MPQHILARLNYVVLLSTNLNESQNRKQLLKSTVDWQWTEVWDFFLKKTNLHNMMFIIRPRAQYSSVKLPLEMSTCLTD